MAYIGSPPASRVLSSADIAQGSVTLDDINFTDQPTNMDISGTIDNHTMRLADGVTVVGDVTLSDNLILSKISDDGNAMTLPNDSSTRTITGTGSLEASTLTQTPNASLTGMTGTIGSGVTMPSGSVIQVKSTFKSDTFTTTNSFVDVTGLNVTITPSSSSNKILVLYGLTTQGDLGNSGGLLNLLRGSTGIVLGTPSSSRLGVTAYIPYINSDNSSNTTTGMFLDSPNTTSATTYKIQVRSAHTGNVYVNRTQGENDATYGSRGGSTITVMEIVA